MVINNPTETDYALVKQGYPDYVRELVWTTEVGEDGTEHIQAYLKLQRSQRLSFVKKLYPRGHFKPIDKDEYALNTKRYVQKDDATTAGQHRQVYHDPIPANDTLLYMVVLHALSKYNKWLEQLFDGSHIATLPLDTFVPYDEVTEVKNESLTTTQDWSRFNRAIAASEKYMVMNKTHIEKHLVSPTYQRIKKDWLKDITMRIIKNAYDDACLEQDAGRTVGGVDEPQSVTLPQVDTSSDSEGTSYTDGEDCSDSGEESESGDSESD